VTAPLPGRVPGHLFLVSTPIGNLGDFSFRAVEVLRSVDVVLAEDTRHTRRLMERYDVGTALLPYHEHNEARTTPRLVERLLNGESFALVSDAGTPLVSDPGKYLVDAALTAGIRVVPIPGANAGLAALVASGMDVGTFTFLGFLPRSGRARGAALDALAELPHTGILYEAANRVADALEDLEAHGCADRQIVVARELTKQFEEFRRGTVAELRAYYEGTPPRGEVVIVLGAAPAQTPSDERVRARVRALREGGASARDAAATAARECGVSRRVAYQMAQDADRGSAT